MTIVLAAAVFCVSIVVVGSLMMRSKRGSFRSGVLRFIGGPFPLSIALHVFLLLFLIITMHESRARDLTILSLEPGGGGGGGDEMRDLDIDTEPMPDSGMPTVSEPVAVDAGTITTSANDYVRSISGIGIGGRRGGGLGDSYGHGLGNGFGGYLGDLRRRASTWSSSSMAPDRWRS